MGRSIATDLTILISAARQLTPEQLDEFRNGRLVVTPAMAEVIGHLHGVTAPPAVVAYHKTTPPAAPPGDKWLQSMDAYDDARTKAESAGASPGTLNALLQPEATHLPCGLTLRPMVLSAYVFLEAVRSPFITGGEITPGDLLLAAVAMIVPEKVTALLEFDADFCPAMRDTTSFHALVREVGGQIGIQDAPLIVAHARRQMELAFPRLVESDGSGEVPAGTAA